MEHGRGEATTPSAPGTAWGGAALDGVGHGSLLAGRYRLEERVRTGPDGSLWRAVDETLDRPVSVRVVRPGHRQTADVVDAARRAALVEDPRLVRVLNVGDSNGSAYIVSEQLTGQTLEDLLAEGPLSAEMMRRLVGEAAQALHRASGRGLHHLRLTPASLVVTSGGDVSVLGTAVEAALAGVEQDEDPLGAEREDAVGLVRILYAGLTGRWPGPPEGPLGPAPRVTGRAVPPGDLVAGVPNDLDTLCTVTLGPHDDGPRSPGDLAEQLAPWSRAQPLTHPRGLLLDQPTRTDPDGSPVTGSREASHARAPGGRAVRHATPAGGMATLTPAGLSDDPALPTLLPRGAVAAASPPTVQPRVPPHVEPRAHVDGRRSSAPAAPSADPAPRPALAAIDDWSLLTAPTRPEAPARPLDAAAGSGRDAEEVPLGPFIPSAPLSRPPRDQARLVLAVVAGLVVLGLVLAVIGLIGLTRADPLVTPGPTRTAAPGSTAGATSAAAAAPAPSSTATASATSSGPTGAASTAAMITGVQAIDPQGDGDENGSTASHAIDGDPATTWRSARYQSSSFGGLKQGLGLFLRLNSGLVTSVTVNMPGSGGTVELRTATGPGLDSSAVVATGDAQGGVVKLTPAQPLTADSLLLWFTALPQQSTGEYRLVVSEITVS